MPLTSRDESELQAYYAMDPPSPPGTASQFGQQLARLAALPKRNSKYQPTPGADVIPCRETYSVLSDAMEDSIIDYIDFYKKVKITHSILSRLKPIHRDVLEARYTPAVNDQQMGALSSLGAYAGISRMTPTAISENQRRRAKDSGAFEPVISTVLSIAREASGVNSLSEDSSALSRTILRKIKDEARHMFLDAADAFVIEREKTPWR